MESSMYKKENYEFFSSDNECFTDEDSNYASHHDNESLNMDENNSPTQFTPNPYQLRSNRMVSRKQNGKISTRNYSTSSSMDQQQSQHHIERMPTRKPNPKIHNRNALMARENRKKKKEHLECLEQSVDSLKLENRTLRKLLNKRSVMVQKLRDERLYLKSIIANKTIISTLLKTIQGNQLPMTSSALSFVTQNAESGQQQNFDENKEMLNLSSTSKENDGSTTNNPATENTTTPTGTINEPLIGDPYLTTLTHFSFTDFDLQFPSSPSSTSSLSPHHHHHHQQQQQLPKSTDDQQQYMMPMENWESLLNDDVELNDGGSSSPLLPLTIVPDDLDDITATGSDDLDSLSNVTNEHNYFNNNFIASNKNKEKPATIKLNNNDPGICLHLANGRVSLEFCASCHRHSQNAWFEEL